MNRKEHLLWILAEECAEVAQRASKAARFGLKEVEPGHPLNNGQRITQEANDLMAALSMLIKAKAIPRLNKRHSLLKIKKVEKYLRYSKVCGTLS